ncbi:chloramphenicol-sensitive protein RarD [Solitalea koreensis]|uniref:Chloramphenicol-sensitive protein RarD n=1 Tax=Solitalea koreensis TaxID=543615 RepID=A0A521CGZ8_9SPHI|nr:chloramphenicol-sensitive protein RarD [Solitalea koreensis]
MIAGAASAIIWGFFSIPLRNLKQLQYNAEEILIYRVITSLLLIWLAAVFFRRDKIRQDVQYIKGLSTPKRRRVLWLSILACLLVTANWFSFIYVVNNVSLRAGAFAYMVCPLLTALGGYFFLKEHLNKLKFISIGLALVSIFLLAMGFYQEVVWSVFVAVLYAGYLIIQRTIQNIDKFNFLGIQLFFSSFFIIPLVIAHPHAFPMQVAFWINILIISIFFTIVPLYLSLYALIGITSSTLGILIYINPIIAFAVAFFYFHETVNSIQILSYGSLLLAVVVFNWEYIKKLKPSSAVIES